MKEKPRQLEMDMTVKEVSDVDRLLATAKELHPVKEDAIKWLKEDRDRQAEIQQEKIAHWGKQSPVYKQMNALPKHTTKAMRTIDSVIHRLEFFK